MNSAFCIFVLCVTAVVAAPEGKGPKQPVCKPACSGGPSDKCLSCPTQCPKTCDNPKGSEQCIQSCKEAACQCTGNTVRAPDGKCVPLSKCPKKPKCTGGPGDKVVTCGTACEPTCKNPKPGVCTKQCVVNVCRCDKGLVRNEEKKCVRPEECKKPEPKCTGGPHDKVRECGTNCPPTCAKPNPGVCTDVCRVNVCQCDSGYVRDSDGKCKLPKDCPKKGGW